MQNLKETKQIAEKVLKRAEDIKGSNLEILDLKREIIELVEP